MSKVVVLSDLQQQILNGLLWDVLATDKGEQLADELELDHGQVAQELQKIYDVTSVHEPAYYMHNTENEEVQVFNSREHLRAVLAAESPEATAGEIEMILDDGSDDVYCGEVINS